MHQVRDRQSCFHFPDPCFTVDGQALLKRKVSPMYQFIMRIAAAMWYGETSDRGTPFASMTARMAAIRAAFSTRLAGKVLHFMKDRTFLPWTSTAL